MNSAPSPCHTLVLLPTYGKESLGSEGVSVCLCLEWRWMRSSRCCERCSERCVLRGHVRVRRTPQGWYTSRRVRRYSFCLHLCRRCRPRLSVFDERSDKSHWRVQFSMFPSGCTLHRGERTCAAAYPARHPAQRSPTTDSLEMYPNRLGASELETEPVSVHGVHGAQPNPALCVH